MMNLIDVIILAVLQGITEWFPVSSSGHLVVLQRLLHLEASWFFDLSLHMGTLCVVVVFFWRDVVNIIRALVRLDFKSEDGKLALLLIVGTVPGAITGLLITHFFEAYFLNLVLVGEALLITGLFLFISRRKTNRKELGYVDSSLIGLAQGFAIIPGISRSGITLSTGTLRKVKREVLFKFSFLLSIPGILGAIVLEVTKSPVAVGNVETPTIILGIIISMVVGYLSLRLLKKIFMMERLHLFAYYCWIVGAMILFYCLSQF